MYNFALDFNQRRKQKRTRSMVCCEKNQASGLKKLVLRPRRDGVERRGNSFDRSGLAQRLFVLDRPALPRHPSSLLRQPLRSLVFAGSGITYSGTGAVERTRRHRGGHDPVGVADRGLCMDEAPVQTLADGLIRPQLPREWICWGAVEFIEFVSQRDEPLRNVSRRLGGQLDGITMRGDRHDVNRSLLLNPSPKCTHSSLLVHCLFTCG